MLINFKTSWLVPAEGYITPPTPLKKGVDNYILHPNKQPEKAKGKQGHGCPEKNS